MNRMISAEEVTAGTGESESLAARGLQDSLGRQQAQESDEWPDAGSISSAEAERLRLLQPCRSRCLVGWLQVARDALTLHGQTRVPRMEASLSQMPDEVPSW